MLALILALLCAPAPGRTFDLARGALTYRVVHKLHEVKGTSQQLEGKALLQADRTAIVQVRARIASFDSGNANRDEHMREATHEASHPYVQLRATATGLSYPLAGPLDVTLRGTLELNGVQQPVVIPAHLAPENSGVRATFSFPISLDSFRVERPQLLFVPVEDRVMIEGDLRFAEAR